jgi:hypothetical protein
MTSKSICIRRARAFQANFVTEVSVKSRKEMQVVAIDVKVVDNLSEAGGGNSKNTWSKEQSFWRWRVLRCITEDGESGEDENDGTEKASRVERNVAPRTDF